MSFYRGPKTINSNLSFIIDPGDKNSYSGSGTSWRDMSGNSLNGTLVNSPTYSESNGGTLIFNGTNQWGNFGNVLASLTDLTIELFVKLGTQSSSYNGIVSKTLDNTDGYEIRTTTYTSTTTGVQFRYKGDTVGLPVVTLTNGSWYHLVATGTNGSQIFYVNNIVSATATNATTPTSNSNSLSIGKLAYAGLYANMTIGTVRIYNRVLTLPEIQQNFSVMRGRYGI